MMLVGAGPSGVGSNVAGRIHLSPNFPSAVPRHGSLPNVNAGVNIQVSKLEPRKFKNNLTMFESKLILKLPPFFMHCVGEGKRR